MGIHIGSGCTTRIYGLPEHNPAPSSLRGKRRRANMSDADSKRLSNLWTLGRISKGQSRYEKALGKGGFG